MVTKVQWLFCKIHDNWIAYFRTPSRPSLHRSYGRAHMSWDQLALCNSQKPHYVTQTYKKAMVHRLVLFVQPILVSAVFCAPKFEDGSQEETYRQERCARGDAWRLVRNILKLKLYDKATFFLTCRRLVFFPAPSLIKLETREFDVDSGASMLRESPLRDLPEWFWRILRKILWTTVFQRTQGRTREFFSWISLRAAKKSGIGYAQYFYSLSEGPKQRYLLEDQDNKGSLQKTHWRSRTSSRKLVTWLTADHKVLSEGLNLETMIDTLSWYKIWQLNGFNHIRAKPKLLRKHKNLQKILEPMRKPKVM